MSCTCEYIHDWFCIFLSPRLQDQPTDYSDFSARITCATTYQLGDKIPCRFEITNEKEYGLYLLKWHTPLDGMRDDFLTISNGGRVIPYDGIFAKRGEPTAENFILVPAAGTVSAIVELSKAYSISTRGIYTVQLETTIQYYRNVNDRIEKALLSHPVTFRVVGNRSARPTMGEEARRESISSLAGPQLRPANCIGGTASERATCARVHTISHQKLYDSYFAAVNNPALYREWFGDPACCQITMRSTVARIYNTMNTDTITYQMHGDRCRPGVYAYTFKNSRTIYYCDVFWQSNELYPPHDSKICTCVHELSHAITSTDDIAYGPENCKRLARDHPDQAVRNADNYGYFGEIQ